MLSHLLVISWKIYFIYTCSVSIMLHWQPSDWISSYRIAFALYWKSDESTIYDIKKQTKVVFSNISEQY